MTDKLTEQVVKKNVQVVIENLDFHIETFEEIFAKRKRLMEESRKTCEDNMKRA